MQENKLTIGNFPAHLASLIRRRGVTARRVAEDTGISTAALSRYLAGQRVPRYPEAVKIAEYFNVHIDYLLNPEKYDEPFAAARAAAAACQGSDAEKQAVFERTLTDRTAALKVKQSVLDTALEVKGVDWRQRALDAELALADLRRRLVEMGKEE